MLPNNSSPCCTLVLRWRWAFSSNLLPQGSRSQWTNGSGSASATPKAEQGLNLKPFRGLFSETSTRFFNLIFPDDCHICGEPLKDFGRVPVCSQCLAAPEPFAAEHFCTSCKTPFVNRAPLGEEGHCMLCRLGLKGFDDVYTFGPYEGRLRQLVHLFKYGKMEPLATSFGPMLARALPREASFDLIVPMPLHWFKRFQRGFNQSELLAKEVSIRWGAPIVNAARRRKFTTAQAGLTNAKRRANVSGAFAVPKRFRNRLDGKHVLPMDDVTTTGATASACARVLKRAGAARVTLLTLARTDRRTAVDLTSLGAHA
jgi:ComF family protein